MKAIIFDMDGVIVDTEPYYLEIYEMFFDQLGLCISNEEKDSFVGCSTRKVWTYLKEKYGLSASVEELMKMEIDGIYDYIRKIEGLKPIEGIPELLEKLRESGIKAAIASSSNRKFIEYIVKRLDVKHYYEFFISGDDVENGKPSPDIFLEAAKRYGCSPEDCVVIEDSANGVTAAKAAGMKCVGYLNKNSGNQDISKADLIIDKFNEENIKAILKFF